MIDAQTLLAAYANGYFPMAESRDAKELLWFHPERRGVIPLDDFHAPRSLLKAARKNPYDITTDKAFKDVITACAERGEDTWINNDIIRLYCELHELGHAHSVECRKDGQLMGGLYGVTLGGAFFGESMFSRASNASKLALVYLVDLLKNAGYELLDAQYVNEHLTQFGIEEIPRAEYLKRLEKALAVKPKACF